MARTKDFDEDEVLTKAMNLFWLNGYNGTSMQDLVDGLGISRSSLYDTFGDKRSLFLKTLENYKKNLFVFQFVSNWNLKNLYLIPLLKLPYYLTIIESQFIHPVVPV